MPPLEGIAHGVSELFEAVKTDRGYELGIDLGHSHLFEVLNLDLDPGRLATQLGINNHRPQLHFEFACLTGLDPFQSRANLRYLAVLKPELGLKTETDLLGMVQHAAVGLQESQIGREIIADPGGAFKLRNDLRVPLKKPTQLRFDILLANGPHRPLDFQTMVLGHRKLGTD